MNEKKENGEKVFCPECGYAFEIKEHSPVWSFTEEGKLVQKALNSVKFWTNLNSTITIFLCFIIFCSFTLIDIYNTPLASNPLIWILSVIVRLLGVFYFYILEIKFFRKCMKRIYSIAFYS
ncbi:MAG: hypothetical protein N2Z65_01370 [Clostridiales bacterium]|nr:hypothetical protein [Clostridiales bacterium]